MQGSCAEARTCGHAPLDHAREDGRRESEDVVDVEGRNVVDFLLARYAVCQQMS
jgi:hypothetical protein